MNRNQLFMRESFVSDLICRGGEFVLRADTLNETERTVCATISTETPSRVFDFANYRMIDEVLIARGMEAPDQVPLLANHNRYSLDYNLGSVRGIKIEGNQVTADLHFVRDDAEVDKVWNKVKQKHLRDVSVGYRALEFTDIPANQSAVINGRKWQAGPNGLRVTTRWRLAETSIVPIGADAAAKIRSEMGLAPLPTETQKGKGTPMKINAKQRAFLLTLNLRAEATDQDVADFVAGLNEQQRAYFDALKGEEVVPPAVPQQQQRQEPNPPATQPQDAPPNVDAVRAEAAASERARIAKIHEIGTGIFDAETITRAISEGWDEARVNSEAVKQLRANRPAPVAPGQQNPFSIHSRTGSDSANVHLLGAGLMHRLGMGELIVDARAGEETRRGQERLAEQAYDLRHLTLRDLVREALRLDGVRNIPHDTESMIRTAVSGAALTQIFTTSVNARLIQSYQEADDTTGPFVRVTDVADFKVNDRISLGKTGSLEKLARGESAKHATISDEKETIRVARYAKQFVVDEQDIIDDNLNALMDMPMEMGLAAGRLRPDMVYALILANGNLSDSVALFDSSRGNDTNTAFSSTSFKTAFTAMLKRQQDGVNLMLRPKFIISVPTLEWTIREYLQSPGIVIAGTAGSVTERPTANVLQGIVQPVIDARLENGVTDPVSGTTYAGTATHWYLAADAMLGRTIEVAYLANTGRRPRIRPFTLDKGQWGLGWDIKLDLGVAALGWRGLQKGY